MLKKGDRPNFRARNSFVCCEPAQRKLLQSPFFSILLAFFTIERGEDFHHLAVRDHNLGVAL